MSYKNWLQNHSLKHKLIVDKLLKQSYSKEKIIKYFSYENMSKVEIDFCPLYKKNQKCHVMDDLNCYLCACPNFRFNDEGIIKEIDSKTIYSFCSIDSVNGEQYIYDNKIHQNCSNCEIPHKTCYISQNFNFDWSNIMKECCYKC
jgi:hypothetical protein